MQRYLHVPKIETLHQISGATSACARHPDEDLNTSHVMIQRGSRKGIERKKCIYSFKTYESA